MFHTRTLNINNEPHLMMWPDSDASCWDLILADWQVMHQPIDQFVQGHDVVVQAGGNCGMYPLLYSKTFKHVYTFEMDSTCFTALAHNCDQMKITRINAAVGDTPQLIKYGNTTPDNAGMHSLLGQGDSPLYAQMLTIDSFKLPQCNLIHLDVEGAEVFAIRGARETILTHRPIVVLEMTNYIEEINQFMDEVGYMEVFVFDPHQVAPINIIFGPKELFS